MRQLQRKVRQTGRQISSVGRGMTLGLTLPVMAFGKVAYDEFTAAQQANAQTAAVLKSTGAVANVTAGHVQRLSTDILKMSGIDDQAAQSAQNLLLTFTGIRNEAGRGNKIFDETTMAIMDMATAMNQGAIPSSDQLKTTTIQVGKALNDPIKGITALRMVGVSFTEQQKEQIEKLVKSGKTMKAQKLILRELNREFAGSAKAAGKTLPAQLARLRESFAGVGASMLEKLMPHIHELLDSLQSMVDWFADLSPKTQKWIAKIVVLGAVLGPVVMLLGSLVGAFVTIASAGGVSLVLGSAAAGLALFAAVGGELPQMDGALGDIIRKISGMRDVLAAAAAGFVAFRVALVSGAALSALAGSLSTIVFTLRAVAGGAATAREAVQLLGFTTLTTPWGAAAAAVGIAVGAIALFSRKARTARNVADDTARAIGGVRDALLGLDDARLAIKEANLGVQTAQRELKIARAELAKIKKGTGEYKDALLRLRQAELGVERASQNSRQARAREGAQLRDITSKIKAKTAAWSNEVALQSQLSGKISRAMSMTGRAGAMARTHIGEWTQQLEASRVRSEKLRPEIDQLNGKLDSIKSHGDKAAAGMRSTGRAMSHGVARGIRDGQGDVQQAAANLARIARTTMANLFGHQSPAPPRRGAPRRIPALASGGIVTRPTVALVGEAGPEAVIPLGRRGKNHGAGNTYHVTVNAGDQRVDSLVFMRNLKIAARMGMV